jgi:endonuclease YncB( thermonuclease family)
MYTIKKTWTGGWLGKLLVGCAGLIILSGLCAPPPTMLGPSTSDQPATATPATGSPAGTATPALATATPAPAFPRTEGTAHVLSVVDGDTIEVDIDGAAYRVRYIGMDTPERGMPGYAEATQANADLVAGRDVWLEKDTSQTDRYGRLLRYVYAGNVMVNEELLRQGMARVATFPPDVKHAERFLALQRGAQAAGLGLWAGQGAATPVPTQVVEPTQPVEPPAQPGAAALVILEVNDREEWVDLQNTGGEPVDLAGWLLRSERGSQDCALGGVIQPGQVLRVWARAEDAGQAGYHCGFDSNIWNNSEPDPAILYDPNGVEVSRRD